MNYLLDTCVISEFTRRKPDEMVIHWVDSMDEDDLFLCAITIGEIRRGIDRLLVSHRKDELVVWLADGLLERFTQRVLPLDATTMFLWGAMTAQLERSGQTMGLMDSLIAATAIQNNLILVTRNVSDFVACGLQIVNPWE